MLLISYAFKFGAAGEGVTEIVKHLERLEKTARQYKLTGMLAEEKEFATGLLRPGPVKANIVDLRLAEAAMTAVNKGREALNEAAKRSNSRVDLRSYWDYVNKTDREEFAQSSGEIVLRIKAPECLLHRLLPALAQGFLTEGREQQWAVNLKQYGGERSLQTVDRKSGATRSIILSSNSPEAGSNPPLLEFVIQQISASNAKDLNSVAIGAVGVIANPLVTVDVLRIRDVASLFRKGASWNSLGGQGRVKWIGVENDPLISKYPETVAKIGEPEAWVASYDELERRIYQDDGAVGLAPVCVTAYTDNRVFRIAADREKYGYRPTALTLGKAGVYPWRFSIASRKSAAPAATSFVEFIKKPAGKNILLEHGYAPSGPP